MRHLIVLMLLVVGWSIAIPPEKAPQTDNYRCILLIGGFNLDTDAAAVEYYHPTEGVECNMGAIGNMSSKGIRNKNGVTSGCYLSSTQQIVIREGVGSDKPPMVYGLKDGSAKKLPLPNPKYITGSTSASISLSKCLSCGGYTGDSWVNNCYQFDSSNPSKWTPIAPMPYKSADLGSVSLNTNGFYVMGGDKEVENLNKVYRLNVANGTWSAETLMPTRRWGHAATAVSKTEFIVCGGYNRFGGLSSCEIYDTMQKKWRTAGRLNQGRGSFAMINFSGNIYALGGSGIERQMNTVERFVRATEKWEIAKAMKHPRVGFVGVAV